MTKSQRPPKVKHGRIMIKQLLDVSHEGTAAAWSPLEQAHGKQASLIDEKTRMNITSGY